MLESKGGHYPGAKNISAYESLFNNEDGTLKSSDELKKGNVRLFEPFKSSRCIKTSFYIPENRPNFPTTRVFRMEISMRMFYQYMTIFFSPASSPLYPLQVENCGSNSRLVVDEDDNGKSRLERVNHFRI